MTRDGFTNILITANPHCSTIRNISYCVIDDLTLDELSKDVETNRSLTPRIHTAFYNMAKFIPDIHRLRVLAFNASFCNYMFYKIERRVSRYMSKPKDIRDWSLGRLRNIILVNKNEHARVRSPKTLRNLTYNGYYSVQVFKRR